MAALRYAARGWAVLPIRGGSKVPLTQNGVKDASTSEMVIRRWWQQWPTANVGIATGSISGIVVLDIDPKNGGEASSAELDTPSTMHARTGGGGWHYLFTASGPQRGRNGYRPGVDIKADGGYIVAPPSMHASGARYEWLSDGELAPAPEWMLQAMAPPPVVQISVRTSMPRTSDVMNRFRKYLSKMPPAISGSGGHNATFAVARKLAALEWDDAMQLLEEFNERCHPPWSRVELEHKLKEAKDKGQNLGIKDRPAPHRPSVEPIRPGVEIPDQSWRANLHYVLNDRTGYECLKRGADNQIALLRHDPLWAGKIRLNEFTGQIEITDPPWVHLDVKGTSPLRTEDAKLLSQWYQREHEFDVGTNDAYEAICVVAKSIRYNPVRDWFDSLTWDGTSRLDLWLAHYLGAGENDYTAAVGRWWLVSAVARTCQPGCKADAMLVLEGKQGTGKSTALNVLAGDSWFSDTPFDLSNEQKSGQGIAGVLIYEFGELASMNRAEVGRVKNYLSSRDDKFRVPWGRVVESHPRRCVFAGTTNHDQSLTDETGNRRFWPVRTTQIHTDKLRNDRDQLWAEAVSLYNAGERWWPKENDNAMMSEQQEERLVVDEWESTVVDWIHGQDRESVQLSDVLSGALRLEVGKWGMYEQKRAGALLRRLGWVRFRLRTGQGLKWAYRKA